MFDCNSRADNMAYALESELNCPIASDIFHEKVAHYFTGDDMADKLNVILRLNGGRPVRNALVAHNQPYFSITEMFSDCVDMMMMVRNELCKAIEEMDYDVINKHVVIELEDILEDFMPFVHASTIWLKKAEEYEKNNKVYKFDTDFIKFLSLD